VLRACICGSDLWPYGSMEPTEQGARIGHEFIGVVEDVGAEVSNINKGELVIAPFAFSDGTCPNCRHGITTACTNGGFFPMNGDGGQGEAVRVPLADGTLVSVPGSGHSDDVMRSLLTLSDVMATGHHAAVCANVEAGQTVAVVGDGAVGLSGVLAAKRLGAERIVLMGRHKDRTDLGREFGATDVVAERGEEGIATVRQLTGGHGTHTVLECVGHMPAYEQAFGVVRAGGVISRVGVPQYEEAPVGFGSLFGRNITLTGGPGAQRPYIEELLPDVLEGRIEPGKVFDRTVGLDGVPDGYRAMDAREALKVLVQP
jgi:threonine dehydrogenase-like Zn-dependent dehydrogenase